MLTTESMHKNGFVTIDELELIKEGLRVLQLQYTEASQSAVNPPQLREEAGRQSSRCSRLLAAFQGTDAKLRIAR